MVRITIQKMTKGGVIDVISDDSRPVDEVLALGVVYHDRRGVYLLSVVLLLELRGLI
jgi:hypothetical protein